jgi:hypothetical protein
MAQMGDIFGQNQLDIAILTFNQMTVLGLAHRSTPTIIFTAIESSFEVLPPVYREPGFKREGQSH